MGAGDTFNFYAYLSDDTKTYALKLTAVVASQGGFATIVDPREVTPYPYGAKNVRYVRGKGGGTKTTRLPIQNQSNSLFVSGGTFTLAAGTYGVEGAIGEKRKLNSVA